MSKVGETIKKIVTFSPLKSLTKGQDLTNDVLAKNPVVAMPDSVEEKKKKMRDLSRIRAGFQGSLNTDLTNKLG